MNVALPDRGSARASATRLVPPWVRARVFLRSLSLQASWNRKGMQSLGVAYALWPAIRWLYPTQPERVRAVRRHLAFFNTHPYLAAAILGGVLRLEERIASGEEDAGSVQRFKEALMYPFAAVGDSFFWLSLRPFAGAVAALVSPWMGLWSILLFLALYDVPHFALRIGMFRAGYQEGENVVGRLGRLGLPGAGTLLRRALALLGGLGLATSAWALSVVPGAPWPRPAVLVPFGLALVVWALSRRLLSSRGPIGAGYLAIVSGLAMALFFGS